MSCACFPSSPAPSVLVLAERLDAAAAAVGLTARQWAELLAAVLPEGFAAGRRPDGAAAATPGTPGKLAAIRGRDARGEAPFRLGDAGTDGIPRR